MKTELYIHESTYVEVMKGLNESGLKVWDLKKFFNNPIIKKNYGIESFDYIEYNGPFGKTTFVINDKKKFFLKIIKLGLL